MTFPIFSLSATLTIIYIFLFKSNKKTRNTICHYSFFLFVYCYEAEHMHHLVEIKITYYSFCVIFFPWEITDKEKQQLCYNNFWKDTFALLQKKLTFKMQRTFSNSGKSRKIWIITVSHTCGFLTQIQSDIDHSKLQLFLVL